VTRHEKPNGATKLRASRGTRRLSPWWSRFVQSIESPRAQHARTRDPFYMTRRGADKPRPGAHAPPLYVVAGSLLLRVSPVLRSLRRV